MPKNVFEHGLVDDDQVWSLADRSKRKAKKTGPVVRKCPSCAAIIPAAARICPHCDAVFVPELLIPDVAEGELQPVDPMMVTRQRIAAMPRWRQLEWAAGNLDRLRLIAEVRGYQPGWACWQQQRTGEGNQS